MKYLTPSPSDRVVTGKSIRTTGKASWRGVLVTLVILGVAVWIASRSVGGITSPTVEPVEPSVVPKPAVHPPLPPRRAEVPPEVASHRAPGRVLDDIRTARADGRAGKVGLLTCELSGAATAQWPEFVAAYAAEVLATKPPELTEVCSDAGRSALGTKKAGSYAAAAKLVKSLRWPRADAPFDSRVLRYLGTVKGCDWSAEALGADVIGWLHLTDPDFAATRRQVIVAFGSDGLAGVSDVLGELVVDDATAMDIRVAAARALAKNGGPASLWALIRSVRGAEGGPAKRRLLQIAGRFPDRNLAFDLVTVAVEQDPDLQPFDAMGAFVEMSRARPGEQLETVAPELIGRAVHEMEAHPEVGAVALQAFTARVPEALRRTMAGSPALQMIKDRAFRDVLGANPPDSASTATAFAWARLTNDREEVLAWTEKCLDARDPRGTVLLPQFAALVAGLPEPERGAWRARVHKRMQGILSRPRELPPGLVQGAAMSAGMMMGVELIPELRGIQDDTGLPSILRDAARDALERFAREAAGRK